MNDYAVWAKEGEKSMFFRLISAEGLDVAKIIAKDLAWRSEVKLVGISPFDGYKEDAEEIKL